MGTPSIILRQDVVVREDGTIVVAPPGLEAGQRARVVVEFAKPKRGRLAEPGALRAFLAAPSIAGSGRSGYEIERGIQEEKDAWDR